MDEAIRRTFFRSIGTFLLGIAGICAYSGNYIGALISGALGILFYVVKDKLEE